MASLALLYAALEWCPSYCGWGLYQIIPAEAVRAGDEVVMAGLAGALLVALITRGK